jgi:hypothetical protein
MLTLTRTTLAPPFNPNGASPVYQLEPAGQTFAVPVTLTLHLDAAPTTLYRVFWSKAGVTNPAAATDFDSLTPTISGNDATVSNTHFSEVFGTQLAVTKR